jgi:hypothetical protein
MQLYIIFLKILIPFTSQKESRCYLNCFNQISILLDLYVAFLVGNIAVNEFFCPSGDPTLPPIGFLIRKSGSAEYAAASPIQV